jgi:hypothetical protein
LKAPSLAAILTAQAQREEPEEEPNRGADVPEPGAVDGLVARGA